MGTIEVARIPEGPFVVTAHGPLDERVAGTLRDALMPLTAARDGRIVLDLDDAHGVDEAVLAVVARAAHLARLHGERISVITRSGWVAGLLRTSELEGMVFVHQSLKDALDE